MHTTPNTPSPASKENDPQTSHGGSIQRTWITKGLILVAVVVLFAWGVDRWLSADGFEATHSESVTLSDQPYLLAAHWFGGAWPVNFWNTDLEARAAADFEKIKADGFNTVVLLVPWSGFAPDPHSGKLDAQRVERLQYLMRLAHEMGLKTVLRISYAWDGLDQDAGLRLVNLWASEQHYQGWLEYIAALWQAVADIPGFQFAFFSWEDLWAATWFVQGNDEQRLQAAQDTGFADWVMRTQDASVRDEWFGPDIAGAEDIRMPRPDEPAYRLFLKFMNQAWVTRFFLPAQQHFPRLSMEIRIDADVVVDGEGGMDWFKHHDAWNLPGAEWVTLYWAPAMGGTNQGEAITPEQAAERLAYWLEEVRRHAGPRQIFIGQFLVEDFTPGYELNGRIPRHQVSEFLALAAPILQRATGGYGLWTWTDYGHDVMANPTFFAGLEGWRVSEGVGLTESGVTMTAEAWIEGDAQQPFYHVPGGPEEAVLCVRAMTHETDQATLSVRQGHGEHAAYLGDLVFSSEGSEHCLPHDLSHPTLRLTSDGSLHIKQVSSVGFVQDSGMRALDFTPKPVAAAYRGLNAALLQRPMLTQPRYTDGWMGRFWIERFSLEQDPDATHLTLRTFLPDEWPERVTITVALDGQVMDTIRCGDEHEHNIPLPTRGAESVMLHIEASGTHQPEADQRQLGCFIVEAAFSVPSS